MKVRLSHTSYVIGLFDVLNTAEVDHLLQEGLQKTSKLIVNKELNDWELDFNCLYNKGTHIRVFKSTKPYVKDKQKLVVIHIPIPTVDIMEWGVIPKQHVSMSEPPGMEKYYTEIEVDFKSSVSLLGHAVLCVKSGISFALLDGITILGQRIKVTETVFGGAE